MRSAADFLRRLLRETPADADRAIVQTRSNDRHCTPAMRQRTLNHWMAEHHRQALIIELTLAHGEAAREHLDRTREGHKVAAFKARKAGIN